MIDVTAFFLELKEEGKERSTYAVHSLRLPTCLQPTPRASSLLVSLNRVTHRSRIRGPAVTFVVTARFRCICFEHHVRDPVQRESVQHDGEGVRTAFAVLRSKETRAGRHAVSTVKCGLG